MTNKHAPTTSRGANWNQQYRPRRVADVHLTTVRSALLQLMNAPHFPQALLFAGPKGTGKTSVSRIIGAMLNDPANVQAVEQRFFAATSTPSQALVEPNPTSPLAESIYAGQSYVVQELDAASNRGIDDIRALKERCALPPSQGRMAVYILDEVHMLTIEAFNALLKLLEEPPSHVVFVLATTELHKLPATIVSRCQLIRFHKASAAELTASLQAIVIDQQLDIDATTVTLLARLADGSFRDAVKLLQQYAQHGGTSDDLATLSETMSDSQVIALLQSVIDKQPSTVVMEIEKLRQQGTDEQYFLHSLLNFLHRDVLMSLKVIEGTNHFSEKIARFLLQQLANPELLKPAPIAFLRLELCLLELIDRAKSKLNGPDTTNADTPSQKPTSPSLTSSPTRTAHQRLASSEVKTQSIVLVEPANLSQMLESVTQPLDTVTSNAGVSPLRTGVPLGDGRLLCEKWSELVAKAAQFHFGLAALLRSAKPIGGSNGEVVVRVYYSFHKEQLQQTKWRQIWDDLTTELAGGVVVLDCVVEAIAQSDMVTASQHNPGLTLEALAVDALMH